MSHDIGVETQIPVDGALVREAERLAVDVSSAAEDGVRRAIGDARAARWLEENAAAIDGANAWVEANGLPLARFRPI